MKGSEKVLQQLSKLLSASWRREINTSPIPASMLIWD
jgi:hypothetical protein